MVPVFFFFTKMCVFFGSFWFCFLDFVKHFYGFGVKVFIFLVNCIPILCSLLALFINFHAFIPFDSIRYTELKFPPYSLTFKVLFPNCHTCQVSHQQINLRFTYNFVQKYFGNCIIFRECCFFLLSIENNFYVQYANKLTSWNFPKNIFKFLSWQKRNRV